MIKMITSKGELEIEMFVEEAPLTVSNFLSYVDDGFFDGTIFHRVIPGFVIQGGGFDAQMRPKATRDAIENEAANGLKNLRSTLSMARTNDPHSATSQFFINLVDNTGLDRTPGNPGYAVFARVTTGLEVMDEIAAAATGNHGGHQDVPLEPIVIEQSTRG